MPYTIVEREDEYCVEKEDDGEIMGCHDTREGAVQQIAAIESNEERSVLDLLREANEEKRQIIAAIQEATGRLQGGS